MSTTHQLGFMYRLMLAVFWALGVLLSGASPAWASHANSKTTLTSSVNPSASGQTITLTATVTGSNPTGTVTFNEGATVLGSATLSNGIATFSTNALLAGNHRLKASYSGDSANKTSSSRNLDQVVNPKVNSSTTVSSSVNPAYVGQSITLTATVTGRSPTGTVTFKNGATTLGTGTLSGGTATFSTSALTVGSHALTVAYGGDAANNASTSSVLAQVIRVKLNNTTTLTSNANPAYVGQTITLTATVTGTSPSGTVTFKDGATTLGTGTLSGGVASFNTSALSAGSHALTATYGGDVAHNTSTSSALTQVINAKLNTTTTLTSSANPAYVGQTITLTATVSGGSPTGSVTFKDGATTLGTVTLSSGVASLSTSALTVGSHTLTATYGGSVAHNASTSSVLTQVVNAKVNSTTTLMSTANPAYVGQNVTLIAAVAGSNPTGTVTFRTGATTLATVTLSGGTATLSGSTLLVGSYAITAAYSGDLANNTSTSSTLTQVINAKVNSTTTLSSSVNPAYVGQNITLTATVSGSSPSGTVTFQDGATILGTSTLSGGIATLNVSALTVGNHSLTAAYGGDIANNTSTSSALTQVINAKVNSTTTLASSANPAYVGQNITLTATVTGSSPSGTVTFKDGATTLATVMLSGGTATFDASALVVGGYTLTAAYSGDVAHNTSTSAALTQVINAKVNSMTALMSSANPIYVGQSITLTATVSGSSPSGTVTFKDGATTLATVTLTGGTATFDASALAVGSHTLTASYSGDVAHNVSTSTALTQVINAKVNSMTSLMSSANPIYMGQSLTLTATVSGSSPSGMVTFKDGATTLATVALSGGTATLDASALAAGSHTLTASYSGDVAHNISTSTALTQVINAKVNSTTSLTSSANPVYLGQSITLTATVSGSNPGGTVTFKDGATTLATVALSGGTATLDASALAAGSHTLTASYSGDVAHNISTSTALTQVINAKVNSTTSLTSSANPVYLGQSITLTATVSGSNPGGTVTFKDGVAVLGTGTVSAGTATLSTSALSAGSHILTATYGGDVAHNASASSSLTQAVNALVNSTTAITSSDNPSYIGQNVTLTATVTGSSPSGDVTFKDGAATLGTITLSGGVANFSTNGLSVGSHMLTATYGGDVAHTTSTSSSLTQVVSALVNSTITLSSNANPISIGESVTLTAVMSPPAATGSVTFKDGTSTLASVNLNAGVATFVANLETLGSHSLSAVYSGDAVHHGSISNALSQAVNAKVDSTTTLSSSANPAAVGQSVTLTAVVAPPTATGSVTFKSGTTTLANVSLNAGVATLATSFSTAGSYSLTGVYSGDAANNASTSNALTVTANAITGTLPSPPISPTLGVQYEYDAQGNLTKIVQAPAVVNMSFKTLFSYDKLERAQDSTDAKLGVTRFAYDGMDRILFVTDPRNLTTNYTRTGLGDTTRRTSADAGIVNLSYDAAGNLITQVDPRGVTATYTYDVLNRPTQVVYSQSGQASMAYTWNYDQTGSGFANGAGRLTSTAHPAGSTEHSYDLKGRVLTDIQSVNPAPGANSVQIKKTVSYAYDNAGHITSIVYPSGRKIVITYADGEPTAIGLAQDASATPAPLVDQIALVPFGPAKSWQWQMASGTTSHQRAFDTSGRMIRYSLGSLVRDLTYDAANRITGYKHYDANSAIAAPTLDQAFDYDELGRLTQVWFYAGYWSFSYDASGNRTSGTMTGNTSTYVVSPTSNRIVSITNPLRNLSYDAAGDTLADGQFSAAYDLSGRMNMLTKAGVSTTYSYDNMGRRVRKFSSNAAVSTVIFVYDSSGQLLGEYDQSGNPLREYVWLGSTPIAVFTPDPANAGNLPLLYYIHADHLNAPRVAVDKNNNVRWRWMAEPFGVNAAETNPSGLGALVLNLRFSGQYFDQESGLHYHGHRSYDPAIGRYSMPDPAQWKGGVNSYEFARNQPTKYLDLDGQLAVVLPWVAPANTDGLTSTAAQSQCRGGDDDDCAHKAADWELTRAGINANEVKRRVRPPENLEICN